MAVSKYGNKKTVVGGIEYDSKAEADHAVKLELLQKAGKISGLQSQVKFELVPKQKGERAIVYIADFVYIENGVTVVEDVKGFKTSEYILKRKLFKYRYPEYEFRETKV